MDNVHDRVWENTPSRRPQPEPDWRPIATWSLLGAMGATFVLQLLALAQSDGLHAMLFVIKPQWWLQPWTPITSTFAHGGVGHLLINGLMLFFFGPLLERIMGVKPFVALFILSGVVSGILQIELSEAFFGGTGGALGASGAIMMVFGALAIIMPTQKILIWGIVPIPFWLAAVGYAALDLLGAFNPADGIGNFAHLAGMAIGVVAGLRLRDRLQDRGIVFRAS